MTQELTVRQAEVGIIISPEVVLENAMVAAKALTRVLSMKKKPVIMNGEQYLEFEDWQTCGQFYGYTVKTGEAVPVEVDGVKGAKAHADLIDIRTGMYLGGAEAYCMRDEEHWNTRPKYEWQDGKRVKVGDEVVPWFQLASMAQTRAGAKAFRNRLAWVAVLAGYRPTPAEEMTGNESQLDQTESHWCSNHRTKFFKSAKMKSFAHPIEGTKDWCYEPTKTKSVDIAQAEQDSKDLWPEGGTKPEPSSATPSSTSEEQQPEASGEATGVSALAKRVKDKLEQDETPDLGIDMTWVRDSIKTVKWSEATLKSYMANVFKVSKEGTLEEVIARLNQEQRARLTKEIQDRLDML